MAHIRMQYLLLLQLKSCPVDINKVRSSRSRSNIIMLFGREIRIQYDV